MMMMMMMMMMLMMIVSFFFKWIFASCLFCAFQSLVVPLRAKGFAQRGTDATTSGSSGNKRGHHGDVDLPNREKHHRIDQKSPGTILVPGSSKWPFQAYFQGHFTPKKGHLTTSNGSLWRSWYTFVGIDVPFLGDVFQTLTNICWRWNIPNSWVMFNWDIYQALI